MPRRKKVAAPVDEATKKRQRQLRNRERREERKAKLHEEAAVGPVDVSWLLKDASLSAAMRVVNRHKQRPYWLSIPFEVGDGNPPVALFYPCTSFRTKHRCYYGFLFREHRELMMLELSDPRRELTDTVRAMSPQSVG